MDDYSQAVSVRPLASSHDTIELKKRYSNMSMMTWQALSARPLATSHDAIEFKKRGSAM